MVGHSRRCTTWESTFTACFSPLFALFLVEIVLDVWNNGSQTRAGKEKQFFDPQIENFRPPPPPSSLTLIPGLTLIPVLNPPPPPCSGLTLIPGWPLFRVLFYSLRFKSSCVAFVFFFFSKTLLLCFMSNCNGALCKELSGRLHWHTLQCVVACLHTTNTQNEGSLEWFLFRDRKEVRWRREWKRKRLRKAIVGRQSEKSFFFWDFVGLEPSGTLSSRGREILSDWTKRYLITSQTRGDLDVVDDRGSAGEGASSAIFFWKWSGGVSGYRVWLSSARWLGTAWFKSDKISKKIGIEWVPVQLSLPMVPNNEKKCSSKNDHQWFGFIIVTKYFSLVGSICAISSAEYPTYTSCGGTLWKHYKYLLSWQQAARRCSVDGAHLAILRNAQDMLCWQSLNLSQYTTSHTQLIWVGYEDQRSEEKVISPADEAKLNKSGDAGITTERNAFNLMCRFAHAETGETGVLSKFKPNPCTNYSYSFMCQKSLSGWFIVLKRSDNTFRFDDS